jgi:hypothetical protein
MNKKHFETNAKSVDKILDGFCANKVKIKRWNLWLRKQPDRLQRFYQLTIY